MTSTRGGSMKNWEPLKVDETRPRAVEDQARLKADRRQGRKSQNM